MLRLRVFVANKEHWVDEEGCYSKANPFEGLFYQYYGYWKKQLWVGKTTPFFASLLTECWLYLGPRRRLRCPAFLEVQPSTWVLRHEGICRTCQRGSEYKADNIRSNAPFDLYLGGRKNEKTLAEMEGHYIRSFRSLPVSQMDFHCVKLPSSSAPFNSPWGSWNWSSALPHPV